MLIKAVKSEFLEVVEMLLQNGADIEVLHNNMSALMYAVEKNNSAMVDLLIRAGASVDGSLQVISEIFLYGFANVLYCSLLALYGLRCVKCRLN